LSQPIMIVAAKSIITAKNLRYMMSSLKRKKTNNPFASSPLISCCPHFCKRN